MPSWGEPSTQRKMVELFTLLALAQMWNLLAGFAGVVSVGPAGVHRARRLRDGRPRQRARKDMYLSVPISALIVAVLGDPDGPRRIPAARQLLRDRHLGAGRGRQQGDHQPQEPRRGRRRVAEGHAATSVASRQDVTYWLAMGAGVGSVLLAYLVLRSRLGLQMQAIRDDEGGARGLGVNVYRTRFVIWIVAAFWTGLGRCAVSTSSSCGCSRSAPAVRSAWCCGPRRSSSSSSSAASARSRARSSARSCTSFPRAVPGPSRVPDLDGHRRARRRAVAAGRSGAPSAAVSASTSSPSAAASSSEAATSRSTRGSRG